MSSKFLSLTLFSAVLTATLSACSVQPPTTHPIVTLPGGGLGAVPPQATLGLERSMVAMKPGTTRTLQVSALTASGEAAAVTVSGGEGCATTTFSDENLVVQAGPQPCSAQITISAPGIDLTRTVQVKVYDPLSLDIGDGLTLKYVNTYTQAWNDRGSGGHMDGAFWSPQPPEGYYSLGASITTSYNQPQQATIVARDVQGKGTLAAPLRYESVWDDSRSGANKDGSVWQPICPQGYVALGVVVQNSHDQPSLDAIRCVAERFTTRGKLGDRIYTDQGTGARRNLSTWQIVGPDVLPSEERRVPLPINTAQGCGTYSPASTGCSPQSPVHVLLVPLTPLEQVDNSTAEVHLSGYQPLEKTVPRFFGSVLVPFTLLPVARTADKTDFNVQQSPFYAVSRTEVYTGLPNGVIDNRQGSNAVTKTFTYNSGFTDSQTTQFSDKVSVKVSASSGVSFLGTGGKVTVDVSNEFGWSSTQASTYSYSQSNSTTFIIPPEAYGEIVQVTTKFQVRDGLGNLVQVTDDNGNWVPVQLEGGASTLKYLQYRPAP